MPPEPESVAEVIENTVRPGLARSKANKSNVGKVVVLTEAEAQVLIDYFDNMDAFKRDMLVRARRTGGD